MRITSAWFLYILVVLASFITLSLIPFKGSLSSMDISVKLLISFAIGLLVFFILIPGITAETIDERTWYSLLLLIAFFTPLALLIWVLWSRQMIPPLETLLSPRSEISAPNSPRFAESPRPESPVSNFLEESQGEFCTIEKEWECHNGDCEVTKNKKICKNLGPDGEDLTSDGACLYKSPKKSPRKSY